VWVSCASLLVGFFFSSRRRHTRFSRDWSSDVCSSDLLPRRRIRPVRPGRHGGGRGPGRAGGRGGGGPRLPRRRHPGDMGASAGGQGAAARRRVGPRAAQRAEGGRRVSGAAGEAGARPGGVLRLRGRVFGPGRYAVMGVVNRTPDSFYDRGATFAFEAALRAADAAVRNGADIIDVGGVKAGYGDEVSVEEEVARTAPFVAELR